MSAYKAESLLWHNVWVNSGEPENGDIYERMKDAKHRYAYAARRVIREQEQLRFQQMAQKMNHTRNFWNEVKKMKHNAHTAPNKDGMTSNKDIVEVFRQKYENLFKSVPSESQNIDRVQQHIASEIDDSKFDDIVISESCVSDAIKQLKLDKSDGNKGVFSNHVKYGPRRLTSLIAILLTTSARHGYMPGELLLSTLHSIPKDCRAYICDSDNYRGIALSSCMTKIYDLVILKKYSRELSTSDMQYAFKKKLGTSMCTLVLKEVMSYFKRNKTNVYLGLIDASKAFDRVRHDKLFMLLIERKLPAVVLRLLLDSYRRQQLRTCWNDCCSENFDTFNGIKQGSILSPVLFTVYMDALLLKLEASGIGCTIGRHYFGALSYADDLTVLSPTLSGFQHMFNICEDFGEEYGVKYNPSKSVGLCVSRRQQSLPDVILAGQPVKWVSVIKHLGNFIQADLRETTEIANKRGDYIGRINSMLATFSKASDDIKRELFNTQCCHLYGVEAWNFADADVDTFRRTWNRGVRRTFNLPHCTHTRLLQYFTGQAYVTDRIYRRFYKLYTRMKKSDNDRVQYLADLLIKNSSSIICKNLQCIAHRYELNYYSRFVFNIFDFKAHCDEETFRIYTQIDELRNARSQFVTDGFLTVHQIDCIIYYLCCD